MTPIASRHHCDGSPRSRNRARCGRCRLPRNSFRPNWSCSVSTTAAPSTRHSFILKMGRLSSWRIAWAQSLGVILRPLTPAEIGSRRSRPDRSTGSTAVATACQWCNLCTCVYYLRSLALTRRRRGRSWWFMRTVSSAALRPVGLISFADDRMAGRLLGFMCDHWLGQIDRMSEGWSG